ncbi:MAG: hypothetical protein ACYSUG_07740 [Planctomycetota bacterium]|jgi:hypothetical protein
MENAAEIGYEEAKPRKKHGFWGWCAAFVRWVFILLFTVILLGGLYFKAPWKILVLDGLLLALLTVVPKKKRKYGWLTLAAAVLVVTVWIFIPEKDTRDWRPYTFDEEVATLNAKYGVPDEENAAPYYEQIEVTDFYADQPHKIIKVNQPFEFNREPRGPAKWDPEDETLSRPWTADEFPEMAAWLETEKEKITPFWKAVELEKCWFEVQTDPNAVLKSFEKYSNVRKSTKVARRMIYQDLAGNNIQGAAEKALALLQCSYHFQQQAALIDNLVGWAFYSVSVEEIRDMVVNFDIDVKSLDTLEQEVNLFEKDWARLSSRFFDYEKVHSKNTIGLLFETNDKGNIRHTRQPDPVSDFTSAAIWGLSRNEKEPSEYWQARKNKLQRFFYWMTYNASLDEISAITDEVQAAYRERIVNKKFDYVGPEKWQDIFKYNLTLKSLMELYAETQIPIFEKIQKIYSRCETGKNATLIVIALRRYYNQHGHWPETLEPIKKQLPEDVFVDSLNGQQIAYMLPENCDTFILYSFGEDGVDDRGLRRYTWQGAEKREDDYLFWPQNEDELKQMLGIEEPEEPEIDSETMEMFF